MKKSKIKSKITNLVKKLIELCDKYGLGDPFASGRAREIVLSSGLGQNIGEVLAECDAFTYDEDGNREEFEYKTSSRSTFKYNESRKATWEETREQLKKKITGNKYHYYAKFSKRMDIKEVYYIDGETVFEILIPKLEERYNTLNNVKSSKNLKDRRLYTMMSVRDIKEFGKVFNLDLLIKKQDSPIEEVIDAIVNLIDVFNEEGLGDPFGAGRTREAILAEFLDHNIGDDLSGEDAYDENGNEFEYKTGFDFNGRYEVSTYPTWEEQEKYLLNEKIGYYKFHYYATFNRKYEIQKVYRISGDKANKVLIPKFREFYDRDKTNLASQTLTANMYLNDVLEHGELIFDINGDEKENIMNGSKTEIETITEWTVNFRDAAEKLNKLLSPKQTEGVPSEIVESLRRSFINDLSKSKKSKNSKKTSNSRVERKRMPKEERDLKESLVLEVIPREKIKDSYCKKYNRNRKLISQDKTVWGVVKDLPVSTINSALKNSNHSVRLELLSKVSNR